MKKNLLMTILIILVLGILMLAAACSSTTPTTTTPPATTTTSTPPTTTTSAITVNIMHSATLGDYLVDSNGMTLYWTTADAPGVSNVSGTNISIWPVFYTATISVPPSLNASDFGSITRSDGTMQTTYKDWPLYYFHNDTAAGQTNGQGVIGRWSVVNPAASGPQAVPTTTTPSTTTTAPTTTTTSGTTFQTLASAGEATYTSTCVVCHGTNGEGTDICPVVIWGQGSSLGSYNGVSLFTDAQGMLNYISKSMPLTAPGSLTSQQYNELLAYILTKGNLVSGSTVFDVSHLSSISIP